MKKLEGLTNKEIAEEVDRHREDHRCRKLQIIRKKWSAPVSESD